MATKQSSLRCLGAPMHVYKAMRAQVVREVSVPSRNFLMESIRIMLVGKEAIEPAADKPLFMCAQGLEDLTNTMLVDKEIAKELRLFILSVTRPFASALDEAVVRMRGKIPIAIHQGE